MTGMPDSRAPGCGKGCGSGVVAVEVKCASVDDPFAIEFLRLQDEAVVAAAEDGALAAFVDEDERLRAGSAGDGDEAGLDAGVGEGLAVEGGGGIVAEFADVAGAESPALAGDDGGGDLASGKDRGVAVFHLRASGGIGRQWDNGVCGVETNADEIDCDGMRHLGMVNRCPLCVSRWSSVVCRLSLVVGRCPSGFVDGA